MVGRFEIFTLALSEILSSWNKDNLRTLQDIEKKEISYKNSSSKKTYSNTKNSNKTKLRFDNFKGRDYDYDDLEKKLLGWDTDD